MGMAVDSTAVGVAVGVAVEIEVAPRVGMLVAVGMAGDAVSVGVLVSVEIGELVAVAVGEGMTDGVFLFVGVFVRVEVSEGPGDTPPRGNKNGNMYKKAPANNKAVPVIANPFCLSGGISIITGVTRFE